jgi:Zn-dependent protease with chaperone function
MDFFAQQDRARKSTTLLATYFGLAVATTILLIYFVPVVGWYAWKVAPSTTPDNIPFIWWYPDLFIGVCSITLITVLSGAAVKISQLRRDGGRGVAAMLGGKEILPDTPDFFERRLRNVVEEMAIASGVPVPPVYVMPNERGINAFAAGFNPTDSVISVTYGTLTALSRDELQGVIAHEFSHILNQDMRINLNLMGMLHGLLVIGLTGRIILEFTGRGSRGRSGKDSGQIVLAMLAAGLTLLVVGYTGFFFCKLIKASISRARERLADASAVQFTRNPAGLAGALKKIGGLSTGSRIRASRAEQASHMFFGNGLRGSMFNTHPPLKDRIKWLEPSFNGRFESFTLESIYKGLVETEGAPESGTYAPNSPDIYGSALADGSLGDLEFKHPNYAEQYTGGLTGFDSGSVGVRAEMRNEMINSVHDVFEKTRTRTRSVSGHFLLESIGRPMAQHEDAAKALIASIPERVREYSNNAYGARMLIYFLLLDSDEEILEKQMLIVKQMAEPEVYNTLQAALPSLDKIPAELRLPIVDITIPALRFLSESQYRAFIEVVKALVEADEQVDVFEYALQRVLTHHLDPLYEGSRKKRAANYYSIRGLVHEASVLLSVLARKCHDFGVDASTAFLAAVDIINDPKTEFAFQDEEQCTWEQLDRALDKLNEGSGQIKKQVLAAALTCMMHDREITVEEVELFRAIAVTLDCPVPPWVTPVELA